MSLEGASKPVGAPIVNESSNGLGNVRGSLAVARKSAPDSGTSGFYINAADNSYLDYPNIKGSGYAVFGHVLEGMDVVDAMVAVAVDGQDSPLTPIVLESARRE